MSQPRKLLIAPEQGKVRVLRADCVGAAHGDMDAREVAHQRALEGHPSERGRAIRTSPNREPTTTYVVEVSLTNSTE
jgi:hypothetical protein